MESRCGELGYVATELHPGTDTNEYESFYNFSNTDGKKLAQLTSQSRFPGDFFPSFSSGGRGAEHVMDMRHGGFTTSVSVEESDFLEEFMACDFPEAGGRDRSVAISLGSMTDLSLAEVDNLPRAGMSGSAGSLQVTPGPGHKFSSSYDQEQENRFPGNHHRRNPPAHASTSHHLLGNRSLKITKQKAAVSGPEPGLGAGSLLRQQLQGSLCSNKYRRAQESSREARETLCRECGKPFTAKCLLTVCMKSDQVLCPDCGQELTAKCLLKSCAGHK